MISFVIIFLKMATLFIPNAQTGEMAQVIDLGGGARCPTDSTQPRLECEKDMSKHTHYVNTNIPKDKAGMFIGKGGVLIKRNILQPATEHTKDDTIKFKVTTQDKDDGKIKIMYEATCPGNDSAPASRAATILKKYVESHVEATEKKLQSTSTTDSQQTSVFIMKVPMRKDTINHFIGKRGQNVSKVVSEIEKSSSNLFTPNGKKPITVNITPDRFVQRGGCFFKIMEGCSEASEHAIITVRAFTKNRRETWEAIHPVIMAEVKRLDQISQSTSTNHNDRYLSTSFTSASTSVTDRRTAFIDAFNAVHSSPSASVADKRAADFITSFNARPPTERGAQIPFDYTLTPEPAQEIDLSGPPDSPGYCPQDEAISPWGSRSPDSVDFALQRNNPASSCYMSKEDQLERWKLDRKWAIDNGQDLPYHLLQPPTDGLGNLLPGWEEACAETRR